MKKLKFSIALCVLLAVLLWTASASGEVCAHAEVKELNSIIRCEDLKSGHCEVEQRLSICLDCGEKLIKRNYGELAGHVFQMAESIHFTRDGMHLCIFICQDCLHLTKVEYGCEGGRRCRIYHAQEIKPISVQHLESFDEWVETAKDEDIIQRWLAREKAE